MWIVRWTIIVIVIIAVIGFSLQNQEQKVQIRIGTFTSNEMPLYFALYLAFSLGLIVFLLISVYNLLQLRMEITRHRRDNRKLREELDRLRNISIEEEGTEVQKLPEKEEGKA